MLVNGCSGGKHIAREEFASASSERNKLFTIRTADGSRYAAWRYSVTDSTLAIEALSRNDERYDTAVLPIVVSLDDVESIEKFGTAAPLFKGAGILYLAIPVAVLVYLIVSGEGVGY